MAIQLREVLFQIRIVWSSAQESWRCRAEYYVSFIHQQSETYNPRHLMMELNGPNVVKVTMEGEEAAAICRPDVLEE